jgi:RNA polymerase-binding transcription factor DksA
MLTPESIELYKERLEKDRLRLVKKAEKESRPEDFGGEAMDPEDEEADEAEEYANDLATSEVLKGRVNEIDAALNKMREGKYGICENCGREIPKEVLDLVPESQYCDNCKK